MSRELSIFLDLVRFLAALAVCVTPWARRDGVVFALVLTLHPISRMLLESIRVDEPPALGTPLSISQLVSLLLLGAAVSAFAQGGAQKPERPLRPEPAPVHLDATQLEQVVRALECEIR